MFIAEDWDGFEPLRVPVDAHPWFYVDYIPEDIDFDAPWQCALRAGDELVPVTVEPGQLLASEPTDTSYAYFFKDIVRLVPSHDLTPATTYLLECSEEPYHYDAISGNYALETRADAKPSLAPPQLEIQDVYIRRGDDEWCDALRSVHVEFSDFDPAFFAEGGLIEARHSGGLTFPINELFDGARTLRLINEGDYTLTAVAANGERSEPRVIDVSTLRDQGVYLPDCSVTGGRSPLTLWILAPLLLIVRRRRVA
ncbi:MAG: hypothetical protein KC636_28105 [Myxococcales bacterium]|nr:hypothetical protein [Myxococcales bacterium]